MVLGICMLAGFWLWEYVCWQAIENMGAGGLNWVLTGLIGTGLIRNTSASWLDEEYDSDAIIMR
jgi:hypothetical protein